MQLLNRFSLPFELHECQLAQRLAQGRITPAEHRGIWHNIVQNAWTQANAEERAPLVMAEEAMTRLAQVIKPLRNDDLDGPGKPDLSTGVHCECVSVYVCVCLSVCLSLSLSLSLGVRLVGSLSASFCLFLPLLGPHTAAWVLVIL